MEKITERLFKSIFWLSRRHAGLVLIFILLAAIAGIFYIRDIPMRTSFFDLLPRDDPLINEFRAKEEYLAVDYLVILLSLRDAEQMTTAERERSLLHTAARITSRLRQSEEIISATYRFPPHPDIPPQFMVIYALDRKRIERLEKGIVRIRHSLAAEELIVTERTDFSSAHQMIDAKLVDAFAVEITPVMIDRIQANLLQLYKFNAALLYAIANLDQLEQVTIAATDLSEIFIEARNHNDEQEEGKPFFSPDRSMLLINIRPRFSAARGLAYSRLVIDIVQNALDEAALDAQGIKAGLTGSYTFAVETDAVVTTDMQRTTVITAVGVILLFLVAFRSLLWVVIAVLPLLISIVFTVAWARFAVGGFNLLTSFLPALVLGLGIDYGIHFIVRYAEERRNRASLNQALWQTLLRKGRASFSAALTTSLVFLSLLFAHSRALFEIGAITSVGIIVAYLMTIIMLPALITIAHRLLPRRFSGVISDYGPKISPFFHWITGKGRAIFVVVIILTLFVSFRAVRTQFQFVSTDLIPRVESHRVLSQIRAYFGLGEIEIGDYFVFFAASEKELVAMVEHLEESELIDAISSAKDLLPVTLAQQQVLLGEIDISAHIDQLATVEESIADRERTTTYIKSLIADLSMVQYMATISGWGPIALSSAALQHQLWELQSVLAALDTRAAQTTISDLRRALTKLDLNLDVLRELPPIETMLRDIVKTLPDGLKSRYITRDGRFIIYARMNPAIHHAGNLPLFIDFAAVVSDDFLGRPMVTVRLEQYIKQDFWLSTLISALLIVVSLWWALGCKRLVIIGLAPLILGYIWMLGGMYLLGMEFNFINILISPLLIGVGVDNGIHILHRYWEERERGEKKSVERAVSTIAIAIIVTSLTTMIVFGGLVGAHTPGLQLLGISALLGISFTLIFSLSFLPATLKMTEKRREARSKE
ncbi:MMPL family transporter [Candidatus Acetothermia bacterium]|nr:MMPL family transporter [Candidatus Acetothermia bacterium]